MQYCYRKLRTHSRVNSLTLAHGNSRLKEDNETEQESKTRRMNVERSTADTKKYVLSSHVSPSLEGYKINNQAKANWM